MILRLVWCNSSKSEAFKALGEKASCRVRRLFFVVIILQMWIQGCGAGGIPSPEAVGEAAGLAHKWSSAVKRLDAEALMRLFLDTCLLECRGFGFHLENEIFDGTVLRFSWRERDQHGSLAGDLAGHLAAYRRVERAEISVSRLEYLGSRSARARFRILVDGILITGHRRSDRGSVEVLLEKRGGSASWLISRFVTSEMETLVSVNPGFRKTGVLNESRSRHEELGGRRLSAHIHVWDESTDEEETPLILIASGSEIGVWGREEARGWRKIQTLSTGVGEISALQYVNIGKEPHLVVATQKHSLFRFVRDEGHRPFSSVAGSFPRPGFLKTGFGNMKNHRISHLTAFADAKNGRLGFYLAIDEDERSAKPMRDPSFSKDFVFWIDPDGKIETREVVFPSEDEGSAETHGLCFLGVISSGRRKRFVSSSSPYMLKVTNRGSWIISGKESPTRISRSWDTGCVVCDFNNNRQDEWLVSGVGNPRPWMYDKPGFPLPWRGLVSPKRWRKRIREAARGSVVYSKQGENKRIDKSAQGGSLQERFSDYPGWVTSPQAVDLNGDGIAEVTAIQKGMIADSSRVGIFWGREFPRLWDSGKPLEIPEEMLKGESRTILLQRNPDGTYSDLAFVLGLMPERGGAGIASISFGDILGHGAMDMLVLKKDGSAEVWANELPQKARIRLRVKGDRKNPNVVGALLVVTPQSGGKTVNRNIDGLDGGRAVIGVGTDSVARVEVVWPDGFARTWENLSTDYLHVLTRSGEN